MTDNKTKTWLTSAIIFMLLFSLAVPGDMLARKKKHGAWLIITKLDGKIVSGELLKVDGGDLLLLLASDTGDKIPINEIKNIKLKKKSLFWKAFGVTCLISLAYWGSGGHNGDRYMWPLGIWFGIPAGLVCGLVADTMSGRYKAIDIEGESPSQIDQVLAYLETKARF